MKEKPFVLEDASGVRLTLLSGPRVATICVAGGESGASMVLGVHELLRLAIAATRAKLGIQATRKNGGPLTCSN